jgi:hypothetical protein
MSNIADNIRKAAMNQSAENMPTGTSTADLQTQLATGATGKGQDAAQANKQSNIAEQIGMVEARAAQQQTKQAGLDVASQVAAKEAAADTQQKEIETANRIKENDRKFQESDARDRILSQIEYSETKLADRKDAHVLESIASDLRLADDKYVHELKMTGARNRLHNSREIALEAARLEIGENTSRIYADIEAKAKLYARKRGVREAELRLDLKDAFKIANAKIDDDVLASKISFGRDMISAGVSTYGSYDAANKAADAKNVSDTMSGLEETNPLFEDWSTQ